MYKIRIKSGNTKDIRIGVLSAMAFWVWKGLNKLSNGERNVEKKICSKVGNDVKIKDRKGKDTTNHREKRRVFEEETSKLFDIENCEWGKSRAFKTPPTYTNEYYIDIDSRTVERGTEKPITNDFCIYVIFYEGVEYKRYQKNQTLSPEQILFHDKGTGFGRYGKVDIDGDHYLKPLCAAHLLGLITEMYINERDSFRIDLGDMSDKKGKAPGGDHKTHGDPKGYSGVCIDYRYLGKDKKSYQGKTDNKNFCVELNYRFLKCSKQWKFKKNYFSNVCSWILLSGDNIEEYGKKISGHDDHGYLTFIE